MHILHTCIDKHTPLCIYLLIHTHTKQHFSYFFTYNFHTQKCGVFQIINKKKVSLNKNDPTVS